MTTVNADVDVKVEIDPDWIYDIWDDMDGNARDEFLENVGIRREYDLSDGVILLGVIAELRRLGFTVEPTEEKAPRRSIKDKTPKEGQ